MILISAVTIITSMLSIIIIISHQNSGADPGGGGGGCWGSLGGPPKLHKHKQNVVHLRMNMHHVLIEVNVCNTHIGPI